MMCVHASFGIQLALPNTNHCVSRTALEIFNNTQFDVMTGGLKLDVKLTVQGCEGGVDENLSFFSKLSRVIDNDRAPQIGWI